MGVSSAVEFVYCLLGVIKDFLYGDWKLLRGNEIVYKLRSFVDFGVPLNYNFRLRTFPVSAAQIVANGGKMGGIEERWDGPSKPAEFLWSAEEWHHVKPRSGRREREARPSLFHSLSHGVQRIQPIITFEDSMGKKAHVFYQNLWHVPFFPWSLQMLFLAQTLWVWRQSEAPFCFTNFETKQKLGIFSRGIGKSGYS